MPLSYSEFGDVNQETPQNQVQSMFAKEQHSEPIRSQDQQVNKPTFVGVPELKYNAIDLITNSIDWQYLNDDERQQVLQMAQTKEGALKLITTSKDWEQLSNYERIQLLKGLYTPEDIKKIDESIMQGAMTITPETEQNIKQYNMPLSPEDIQQAEQNTTGAYERLYERSKGGEITPQGYTPEEVETAVMAKRMKEHPILTSFGENISEHWGDLLATVYKLTGNEEKRKDIVNRVEEMQAAYERAKQVVKPKFSDRFIGGTLAAIADPVNLFLIGANVLGAGVGNAALAGRLGKYAQTIAKAIESLPAAEKSALLVSTVPWLEGAGFTFLSEYGKTDSDIEVLDKTITGAAFFTGLTSMAKFILETPEIAKNVSTSVINKISDLLYELKSGKKPLNKMIKELKDNTEEAINELPKEQADEIINKATQDMLANITKQSEDIQAGISNIENMPLRAKETPVIEQTGDGIGKTIPETEKGVESEIKGEIPVKETEQVVEKGITNKLKEGDLVTIKSKETGEEIKPESQIKKDMEDFIGEGDYEEEIEGLSLKEVKDKIKILENEAERFKKDNKKYFYGNKPKKNAPQEIKDKWENFKDRYNDLIAKKINLLAKNKYKISNELKTKTYTQLVKEQGGLDINQVKIDYPYIKQDIHPSIVNKNGKFNVDEMADILGLSSGDELVNILKKERQDGIKLTNKGFISPELSTQIAARGTGALVGGTAGYKMTDENADDKTKRRNALIGAAIGALGTKFFMYRDPLKETISYKATQKLGEKFPKIAKVFRMATDKHGLGTMADKDKERFLNEVYYGTYRRFLGENITKYDEVIAKLKKLGMDFRNEEEAIRYLTNPEFRKEVIEKIPKLSKDLQPLAKEYFGVLDYVRELADANTQDLFERGLISFEAFKKNMGSYTKRTYKNLPSGQGKIPTIKFGRKFLDIFEETTPEQREAFGYIADTAGETAATLAFQARLRAWDEYMRTILKEGLNKDSKLITEEGKKLLVELPEVFQIQKLPHVMSPTYAKNVLLKKFGTIRSLMGKIKLYEKGKLDEFDRAFVEKYLQEAEAKGYTIKDIRKIYRDFVKEVNKKSAELGKIKQNNKLLAEWRLLPNETKYGVLSGLPVDRSLADMIATYSKWDKEPTGFATVLDNTIAPLYSIFRWAKTVGGMPYSVFKNTLGNWHQWVGNGGSIQSFPVYFLKGLKSIISKDSVYKKMKELGMLKENYAEYEIKRQMQKVFGVDSLAELEKSNSPKRALAFLKKLMDEGADWYGAIDDATKIGRFLYERKKGKNINEAIRIAQDTGFDYGLVPKTIKIMRDVNMKDHAILKLFGNPFITYAYKYNTMILDMLRRYPLETAAFLAGTGMFTAAAAVKAWQKIKGIPDKYKKLAEYYKPAYFDNYNTVGFYNPEDKMFYYIDFSNTSPDATLFKKFDNAHSVLDYLAIIGKGVADTIGFFRHPLFSIYHAVKGKDVFDVPIYYETDSEGKKLVKGIGYIAKTFLMPATIERLMKAKINYHPDLPRIFGFYVYRYPKEYLERLRKLDINKVAMDAGQKTNRELKKLAVKIWELKQRDLDEVKLQEERNKLIKDTIEKLKEIKKEKIQKQQDRMRYDLLIDYLDAVKQGAKNE